MAKGQKGGNKGALEQEAKPAPGMKGVCAAGDSH